MFVAAIIAALFLGGAKGPTGLDLHGAQVRMEQTLFGPEKRDRAEAALSALGEASRDYAALRARSFRALERIDALADVPQEELTQAVRRVEREEARARARLFAAREALRNCLTAEEWRSLFSPSKAPGAAPNPPRPVP